MNAQQIQIADKIYDLIQSGQADLVVKKTFIALMTRRLIEALASQELGPAQKFLDKTKTIEGMANQ